MASRAFSLNSIDWRKILIGLAMALLGALATYLLDKVVPIFNDQGDQWSLLLAALLAALANAAAQVRDRLPPHARPVAGPGAGLEAPIGGTLWRKQRLRPP